MTLTNSWLEPEKISGEEAEQFESIRRRFTERLANLKPRSFHPDDSDGIRVWRDFVEKQVAELAFDLIEESCQIADGFIFHPSKGRVHELMRDVLSDRLWAVTAEIEKMDEVA